MSTTRSFDVVNQSVTLVMRDALTGLLVDGLIHSDFDTVCYRKGVAGAIVDVTPVTLAAVTTAHADGGIKELDATKAPGAYRVDLPDAAFTSGAGNEITVFATSGDAVAHLEVSLAYDIIPVSGRVPAKVEVMDNDVLTNAAIAANAISSGELSDSAVAKIVVEILNDSTPFNGADVADILATVDAIVAILGAPAGASLAADIATRLATSGYTAPPTTAQVADGILARNVAGGGNGTRTVAEALARLRNHVGVAAGTMTVYAADDTTPLWTAALTTAAGNPVSDVNPS